MRLNPLIPLLFATVALTGCNSFFDSSAFSSVQEKMNYPLPTKIEARMRANDMARNAPITIRIFKEEGVLEIWKQKRDGTYGKLESYEICAWSGKLGPKKKEGDRQAPEGFYPLTTGLMNPYSKYFLAINTGYPNRYDSANALTGSNLMIHGACSSAGCYSMTDEQILEIFAFARDAFKGGQQSIMLQAYPFRMTAANMVRHRYNENYDFWEMLKPGYDYFEVTQKPAKVDVCDRRYVFNEKPANAGTFVSSAACPAMVTTVSADEQAKITEYEADYQKDYDRALKKNADMVWIDPTEAQRKALVADTRPDPTDALYQPTGPSLEAGRYLTVEQYQIALARDGGKTIPTIDVLTQTAAIPESPEAESAQDAAVVTALGDAAAPEKESGWLARLLQMAQGNNQADDTPSLRDSIPAGLATGETAVAPSDIASAEAPLPPVPDVPVSSSVPIPEPSPLAAYAEVDANKGDREKKPFWKFW
ncbi:murein L,D-transpeptidase [Martelella alba]|uniref:Murein L,D-transpeptidase n=1 Tax=Martelella alba TaxID=2590451 RepID=A0A506UG49_9HYPH|nr:murein L,D-transpeptidase family protein [Martelella alba]TPW32115.1 murein L,D-transpeptidase [Martelella alba]